MSQNRRKLSQRLYVNDASARTWPAAVSSGAALERLGERYTCLEFLGECPLHLASRRDQLAVRAVVQGMIGPLEPVQFLLPVSASDGEATARAFVPATCVTNRAGLEPRCTFDRPELEAKQYFLNRVVNCFPARD